MVCLYGVLARASDWLKRLPIQCLSGPSEASPLALEDLVYVTVMQCLITLCLAGSCYPPKGGGAATQLVQPHHDGLGLTFFTAVR